MSTYTLKLEAILEDELYTTPPLTPVIVAKLNGTKRDIPRAFNVTRNLPDPVDIKHLRRIKDVPNGSIECIVCSCKADLDEQVLQIELDELERKLHGESIFSDYRIMRVPSKYPTTIHQMKACDKIWPCKFAKNNYLIKCIEGSIITDGERLVINLIVNKILSIIENDENSVENATVIFRYAKIYGVGVSNISILNSNPTKHSTMLCIDSVATNSGAGHWNCLAESDKIAKAIQTELDKKIDMEDHDRVIDTDTIPYLCTDYDVFVTEEPCIMCTMGLVQSRVRRLFYLDSRSVEKIKGCRKICHPDHSIEKYLIHRDRNLNHRFEAWRITLQIN